MKVSTLVSSLAVAASLATAQFSPACHGVAEDGRDGTKDCKCCIVWSYTQNACIQAQKDALVKHYETCKHHDGL